VDDAPGEVRLHFLGVGGHVRRVRVGAQGVEALPLLDDEEGVVAVPGLDGGRALGVDGGPVLDAALLGAHRGHVGVEGL